MISTTAKSIAAALHHRRRARRDDRPGASAKSGDGVRVAGTCSDNELVQAQGQARRSAPRRSSSRSTRTAPASRGPSSLRKDGRLVFQGTRTTLAPSGSFSLERRIAGTDGRPSRPARPAPARPAPRRRRPSRSRKTAKRPDGNRRSDGDRRRAGRRRQSRANDGAGHARQRRQRSSRQRRLTSSPGEMSQREPGRCAPVRALALRAPAHSSPAGARDCAAAGHLTFAEQPAVAAGGERAEGLGWAV